MSAHGDPPMAVALTIRPERPGDEAAITDVTREAFAFAPHTSHTEHAIVQALRGAGALSVSLVAESGGRIVGHIAFSPVSIADGSPDWHGLGPVSVIPRLQGQGIARALVEQGLVRLRELGAQGCVVLGEPALYGRFGFASDPGLVLPGVPQPYFQSLAFGPARPRGEVSYHEAFSSPG